MVRGVNDTEAMEWVTMEWKAMVREKRMGAARKNGSAFRASKNKDIGKIKKYRIRTVL